MSVLNSEKVSKEKKSLSLIETLVQSLSLLFALQNKEGRKKMMDLAEKNPLSIVISGVLAMSIFFTICLSSQIVLHIVMNK
mgnify:CR=1 FL=1